MGLSCNGSGDVELARGSRCTLADANDACRVRLGQLQCSSRKLSLAEERVDERGGLERSEIVGPLAEADQLHGNAEFLLHAKDDPALGRTVELGQDDTGDLDHLGEDPGLRQAVLADRRVDHQQDLVDTARLVTTRLTLPSSSIRPVLVCSRPAVSMTTTSAPWRSLVDGVERHRRGIGALGTAHHLGADPDAQRLQLVGRRGTERVGRAEDDPAAVGDEDASELADRRRLARAVDADDQQHRGLVVVRQRPDRAVQIGV